MIYLPEKCLRGLKTCQPLAQISAENAASFFCCGENDGTERHHEQDKYTLCFKNGDIDQESHNDKRDLTHNASVLVQALSIIEEKDYDEEST